MRLHTLFVLSFFTALFPSLAATSCNAPQVLLAGNCTLTGALGWLTAGQGTASVITIYVPPNATAPVDIEITALASSLGNAYSGYFGIVGNDVGQPGGGVVTLNDIKAGAQML